MRYPNLKRLKSQLRSSHFLAPYGQALFPIYFRRCNVSFSLADRTLSIYPYLSPSLSLPITQLRLFVRRSLHDSSGSFWFSSIASKLFVATPHFCLEYLLSKWSIVSSGASTTLHLCAVSVAALKSHYSAPSCRAQVHGRQAFQHDLHAAP